MCPVGDCSSGCFITAPLAREQPRYYSAAQGRIADLGLAGCRSIGGRHYPPNGGYAGDRSLDVGEPAALVHLLPREGGCPSRTPHELDPPIDRIAPIPALTLSGGLLRCLRYTRFARIASFASSALRPPQSCCPPRPHWPSGASGSRCRARITSASSSRNPGRVMVAR